MLLLGAIFMTPGIFVGYMTFQHEIDGLLKRNQISETEFQNSASKAIDHRVQNALGRDFSEKTIEAKIPIIAYDESSIPYSEDQFFYRPVARLNFERNKAFPNDAAELEQRITESKLENLSLRSFSAIPEKLEFITLSNMDGLKDINLCLINCSKVKNK